jgi:hypothetical protein
MKIKHISELEKMMTPEAKKISAELFKKYYTDLFGDCEPILCGPEGRAAAKGPEALKKYYEECEDYNKPIDMDDWD